MKVLFKAIRSGNLEEVRRLIEKKPELVNCTAKQPPKKDDGQSPLQVAIKTHNFEIANYLIDQGADINFMEDPAACCDDWCMPVLHISVMAAVSCCRHNSQFATDSRVFFTEYSSAEEADASFALLERLLTLGGGRFRAGISRRVPGLAAVQNRGRYASAILLERRYRLADRRRNARMAA